MPGELALSKLLSSLTVSVNPAVFVFLTIPYNSEKQCQIPLDKIQMTFREQEGLTLIVEQKVAESYGFTSTNYTFQSKQLTCEVHSSLEAVGFMAAMSKVLAESGIGCNPVSGYFHDHLFVPLDKADEALEVLKSLAREANEG